MEAIDKEKILIEEIKVVQDIIKRMANNSSNVKTWVVTLIAATLLVKGNNNHVFVAFIPLFAFWFLDVYYLRQERLYRKVHERIVLYRPEHEDNLFNMSTYGLEDKIDGYWKTTCSVSIFPFYFGILILLVGYSVLLNIDTMVMLSDYIYHCSEVVKSGK